MAVSYLVPYRKQATLETLKTVYAVLISFKAQYLLLWIINRTFQWTLGERLYQNLNHKLTAGLLFSALLTYKSPVFDVIVFTPCIHRLVLLFLCKVSKIVRTQRTAQLFRYILMTAFHKSEIWVFHKNIMKFLCLSAWWPYYPFARKIWNPTMMLQKQLNKREMYHKLNS